MLDLDDASLTFDAQLEKLLPLEIVGPQDGWRAEDMGCENINYVTFMDEDNFVEFQQV